MKHSREEILSRFAQAITDETPVDWVVAKRDHPHLGPQIDGLRLLERIAQTHRSAWSSIDRTPVAREPSFLFRWGHLGVLEKIGEGGFGTVYRAYDPRLQREVALKIIAPDRVRRGAGSEHFLGEARRMARVRHPNVLIIHGADEHDGKIGLWTDLIDGFTLEARLRSEGPMGPSEAAVVGIEICRALAAVHQAGMVHGDVKASNVMRDARGGIVLMDFGSGVDRHSDPQTGTLRGTPLTLAPEILRGLPPSPSSDLYALGVLLYRLVSDRYPVPAEDLAELEAKHRSGARVPLLDLRPDLPARWIGIVDRAIALDPSQRFRTAGAMERELADFLAGGPAPIRSDPATRRRRALPWAGGIALAALLASALWIFPTREKVGDSPPIAPASVPVAPGDRSTGTPAAVPSLAVEATLYRSHRGAKEALSPGTLVRPGDTLFMEVQSVEPIHFYLLNEDQQEQVYVLFPIPGMDTKNPLAAGGRHRLPGARGGLPQDWQITEGQGEEHFLLIASRIALTQLERQIEGFVPASPDRSVNGVPLDPNRLLGTRGIGGVVPGHPLTASQGSPTLTAIARALTTQATDPGGLWLREFVILNAGS